MKRLVLVVEALKKGQAVMVASNSVEAWELADVLVVADFLESQPDA